MSKQVAERIEKILALLPEQSPEKSDTIATFIKLYVPHISSSYLKESSVEELYSMLMSHWLIAAERQPASNATVRVYNPQLQTDGWESPHTVIDIVTGDDPFLVDSVRIAVNHDGAAIHLSVHPVLQIERDDAGACIAVTAPANDNARSLNESFMHFQIDRQNEAEALDHIRSRIEQVLEDVHTVVADFTHMRDKLSNILSQSMKTPPPLAAEELSEGHAFLKWLLDDHFVFLGYREHSLVSKDDDDQLNIIAASSLGILRKNEGSEENEDVCQSFAVLPAEIRRLARVPELLILTRSGSESRVHRAGYMEYIGIKIINSDGIVTGEHRFLGLYTSSAYTGDTKNIPVIRRKVDNVLQRSGLHENSHAERSLASILETYPRDELFHISEDELLEVSLGIMQLQERQKTTVFIRKDPYRRFFNCLIFIPRDHFNTEVRQNIGAILERALGGETINFSVQINESLLARVNFLIHTNNTDSIEYDIEKVEGEIVAVAQPWRDLLKNALITSYGEEQGNQLFNQYGSGFRADYRESYTPAEALQDLKHIACLHNPGDISMTLFSPAKSPANFLHFKLFSYGNAVALSSALPMLENMGLRVIHEDPSKIKLADGHVIWIHDFGMQHTETDLQLDSVKHMFEESFRRIFKGESSNDGFNRLTLRGGLDWRRIDILRAYSRYLRQVRGTFSQEYIIQAMVSNAHISSLLIEQFENRFDPAHTAAREANNMLLETRINEQLEKVESLDEDRIIRRFMGAINATLRTNYYQTTVEGQHHPYLSLKFDSKKVPDMPEPRPKFEIFVYSPRVEGVHLRGGTIARGGLRWSDRQEDFRTEVLGLVKAQMVKNSVIVPDGSKGGFLTKQLPVNGTRDEILAEGIQCYRTFISGLLDVTDNLVDGIPVPPSGVVRHDGDDPYLVVAADKGTATFSDIANDVAASYNFWLGDAFASGGSVGYDHKGMGITARGAWESVRCHFRDLAMDIDNNPFTVVGIGDMSGDVFGNGMLLSRNIQLIAAFNHQHIFLDPNPDCAQSFAERQRLFNLPRSSWDDYNRELISSGGGIYLRSLKSIPLSDEMRARLNLNITKVTPNELIQILLKAEIDLLWNGGIGTYVKATQEQHSDIGDRNNDALRINGNELRCKIIGEGGNLGFSQLGRIEFARNKGRAFTDAIDNSAGVDCSDHEVNIKILLNAVMGAGLLDIQQRNNLLASMTDEVALLVLKNNYQQTQALSLSSFQSQKMLEVHVRLIRKLEHQGALNRAIEYLPSEDLIQERLSTGEGLTAPELSVLMAYVKIGLCRSLVNSDVPDDPYLEQTLIQYFPTALQQVYLQQMMTHRLRREIIATEVANSLVNRAGLTFVYRLQEETGATEAEITQAYIIVRDSFNLTDCWKQIEQLNGVTGPGVQKKMILETRKLLERSVRWVIQNAPRPILIDLNIERYQAALQHITALLRAKLEQQTSVDSKYQDLLQAGVPEPLAARTMLFDLLPSSMDMVEISISTQTKLEAVVDEYFSCAEHLQLSWLGSKISELPRNTHWQAIARGTLRDDLLLLQKMITTEVLNCHCIDNGTSKLEHWSTLHYVQVERCRQLITELHNEATTDFTTLSVVMRELYNLIRKSSQPNSANLALNPQTVIQSSSQL